MTAATAAAVVVAAVAVLGMIGSLWRLTAKLERWQGSVDATLAAGTRDRDQLHAYGRETRRALDSHVAQHAQRK